MSFILPQLIEVEEYVLQGGETIDRPGTRNLDGGWDW